MDNVDEVPAGRVPALRPNVTVPTSISSQTQVMTPFPTDVDTTFDPTPTIAIDPIALITQECITITSAMRKHARWSSELPCQRSSAEARAGLHEREGPIAVSRRSRRAGQQSRLPSYSRILASRTATATGSGAGAGSVDAGQASEEDNS